ncbi:MAG: hypothetical protein M0R66_07660 [Candidatus Omnitrophica bacterium]|nr:hypothetical protein [Candidatus Omnitrophota bacterium]
MDEFEKDLEKTKKRKRKAVSDDDVAPIRKGDSILEFTKSELESKKADVLGKKYERMSLEEDIKRRKLEKEAKGKKKTKMTLDDLAALLSEDDGDGDGGEDGGDEDDDEDGEGDVMSVLLAKSPKMKVLRKLLGGKKKKGGSGISDAIKQVMEYKMMDKLLASLDEAPAKKEDEFDRFLKMREIAAPKRDSTDDVAMQAVRTMAEAFRADMGRLENRIADMTDTAASAASSNRQMDVFAAAEKALKFSDMLDRRRGPDVRAAPAMDPASYARMKEMEMRDKFLEVEAEKERERQKTWSRIGSQALNMFSKFVDGGGERRGLSFTPGDAPPDDGEEGDEGVPIADMLSALGDGPEKPKPVVRRDAPSFVPEVDDEEEVDAGDEEGPDEPAPKGDGFKLFYS